MMSETNTTNSTVLTSHHLYMSHVMNSEQFRLPVGCERIKQEIAGHERYTGYGSETTAQLISTSSDLEPVVAGNKEKEEACRDHCGCDVLQDCECSP